jgi:hypothetical protein
MAWGKDYYGLRVPPELMTLAPLLAKGTYVRPRFAMAHQPSDTRIIDDAARLVAFSGVPAYIANPNFMEAMGGAMGEEARRRLAALAAIDRAPDLDALRLAMRAEGITHYVVTSPRDAPFDPERLGAIGRAGAYAIYTATPSG